MRSLEVPASSIQNPASRVQRPESSLQLLRPEPRNSGMSKKLTLLQKLGLVHTSKLDRIELKWIKIEFILFAKFLNNIFQHLFVFLWFIICEDKLSSKRFIFANGL